MPECAFHPGVETEVRCTECERYICPKDMVETPVGYKCRECARPARSQYVVVKPRQLLRAILVGGAVGVLGGVVMAFLSFGFFVCSSASSGAARRPRRRGAPAAAIANGRSASSRSPQSSWVRSRAWC